MNTLLHTPVGVRDIYDGECSRKNTVEAAILRRMHLFGYSNIETPTFEFFDIFNQERGSVPSREMFKFFDRDNNTLVLRPDMTPAIARCVAKFFMEEDMALRLCYLEKTFINNYNYRGRLTESTQSGAELIGDDSADADAEIVVLVIKTLLDSGLKDFQVELGQVEFYRGLLDEAKLGEEDSEALRELIENKNYFGLEEYVDKHLGDNPIKHVFLKLPELFGSVENIEKARNLTTNKRALDAIDRLLEVHKLIDLYGLSEYVSYDLGMLSQYKYYTGIIFKAYSYGTGDYIVNGGRYNKLLVQFGKDAPAIGFGIIVDTLLAALSGQHIDIPTDSVNTLVVYEKDATERAFSLINTLREKDLCTTAVLKDDERVDSDYLNYAKRYNIKQAVIMKGNVNTVELVNIESGDRKTVGYEELL